MFIPQNHPKSQQRVRTCAVKEKPVFRASLALSMLEIELYQIFLPYDRGRSGYEIKSSSDTEDAEQEYMTRSLKVKNRW